MKRKHGIVDEEEFFKHFTIGNLDARSVQHGPRIFMAPFQQHGGNHEDRGAHPQDQGFFLHGPQLAHQVTSAIQQAKQAELKRGVVYIDPFTDPRGTFPGGNGSGIRP